MSQTIQDDYRGRLTRLDEEIDRLGQRYEMALLLLRASISYETAGLAADILEKKNRLLAQRNKLVAKLRE